MSATRAKSGKSKKAKGQRGKGKGVRANADRRDADRVVEKIKAMRDDLAGDVKRLTNFTPEYRLRVGEYRALFEVEGDRVVIYRVRHRKDAYS